MSWCSSLLLGLALSGVGQTAPVERPRMVIMPRGSDLVPQQTSADSPEAADLARGEPAALDPANGFTGPAHNGFWPEVWGYVGGRVFYAGTRMAPNGLAFHPLATLDGDINVGLLPQKKLYIFGLSAFWLQRATADQTQSNWDFTKREFDLTLGVAWNYWNRFEFRCFGYAYNNLNRGESTFLPRGYNDGVGLENRYYFWNTDIYDISKLAFISAGYLPAKTLVGNNGDDFRPGFFARAYLTYDFNFLGSYAYLDSQLICEKAFTARLIFFDFGVAFRPCPSLAGLEFRLGGMESLDVIADVNRDLGYLGVRLLF